MKLSKGFTKLVPSVMIFVFYAVSFVMLTLALKNIEVSIVYAIWAGVGISLISAIGILFFREAVSALKLVSIFLIIIGVLGLHISGAKH